MWIFTRYGFYSAAVKGGTLRNSKALRDDGASFTSPKVEVRARVQAHLTNLKKRFPVVLRDYRVLTSPHNDYGFRMVLPMSTWEVIVSALVLEQTWGNFKNEVERYGKGGSAYAHALHTVWEEMYQLQRGGVRKRSARFVAVGYERD